MLSGPAGMKKVVIGLRVGVQRLILDLMRFGKVTDQGPAELRTTGPRASDVLTREF